MSSASSRVEVGEHRRLLMRRAGQHDGVGRPAVLAVAADEPAGRPAAFDAVETLDAGDERRGRADRGSVSTSTRSPSRNDHMRGGRGAARRGLRPRRGAARATAAMPRDDAAVLALQRGQAREGGRHAQQRRVAGVDAGDEGVGEHVGRFAAGAAAGEGVDRFVAAVAPRRPKALQRESSSLPRSSEDRCVREASRPPGRRRSLAVEEEVAILCRRPRWRGSSCSPRPRSRQSCSVVGLVSRKPLGPVSTLKAVAPLGPDGAAGAVALFEDGDLGSGQSCWQPDRRGQAGDAGADDDDAGHGGALYSGHGSRRCTRNFPHRSALMPLDPAEVALFRFLAANLRLEDVLQPILDLLVRLVDFLVGQRAVVGLVGQRVGQALRAGRDARRRGRGRTAARRAAGRRRRRGSPPRRRSAGTASSTTTAMSRSAAGKRGTGV